MMLPEEAKRTIDHHGVEPRKATKAVKELTGMGKAAPYIPAVAITIGR
jgi:hypothetical protein